MTPMFNSCSLRKIFVVVLVLVFFLSATASVSNVNAAIYTYTLRGPYYENGGVANADVVVGVLWVNGSTLYFNMSANGVTANVTTFTSTSAAYQMLWNASSTLNYTRIIDFLPQSEDVNVYIPSPLLPSYPYTFSVISFAGVTNAYLQTSISTDGSTHHVVERASLNASGSPSFIMAQQGTYTMTFICDEGTYSQQFIAQNIFSESFPVPAGVFITTNATGPTTDAIRINSTAIGINYQDPSNNTNWFNITITHQSGSLTVFDYSNTPTSGSPQTIIWNGGDTEKDYTVNATSMVGTQQYIWTIPVSSTVGANPWLGIWDWLGKSTPTMPYTSTGWPLGMTTNNIAQIVASAIILFFLSIGSYKSSGATCIIAWIMSGFLIAFGWWGNGLVGGLSALPEFALSGFLAIMIHIGEAKDSAREV